MKITISSSSSERIDDIYRESSQKLLDYLVSLGDVELNWGSGSISIMGMCYDTFAKAGKKTHGFTSPKYAFDIENLPDSDHTIYDTTYDLKKHILYAADVVIFLPGGTGTISEVFGHIEEVRSNDANKLLIIYNETHHFDSVLAVFDDLIKRKFDKDTIYDNFKVAYSIRDVESILKETGKI